MKIVIDNYIGDWEGVTEKQIRESLASIKNEETVELIINSPGGDVYEGIAIFNLIREVAKTHTVSVTVSGLAASMASYIALAARTVDENSIVKVSDNSIFMIHNPYTFGFGDYKSFEKTAGYLKQLAGVLSGVYQFVSKKSENEIKALMDDTIFFVGKEICDAGFANNFEKIGITENAEQRFESRDALIVNAKAKIKNCYDELKKNAEKAEYDSVERAAALLQTQKNENKTNNKNTIKDSEEFMNVEELKASHKTCYDEVFSLGEKAASEKERERVSAHLKLAEKCGAYELAAKFIADGKITADADVQAAYMDFAINKTKAQNRIDDNPPAVNTESGEVDGDEKALMAEFEKGFFGKEV